MQVEDAVFTLIKAKLLFLLAVDPAISIKTPVNRGFLLVPVVGLGHFCADFSAKISQFCGLLKRNRALLGHCSSLLSCTQFWTR